MNTSITEKKLVRKVAILSDGKTKLYRAKDDTRKPPLGWGVYVNQDALEENYTYTQCADAAESFFMRLQNVSANIPYSDVIAVGVTQEWVPLGTPSYDADQIAEYIESRPARPIAEQF